MLSENVFVCLIEIYYTTNIVSGNSPDSNFYSLGFIIAVINTALILSPDFVECLLNTLVVIVLKVVIGFKNSTPLVVGILIPIAGIYLANNFYMRYRQSRVTFLNIQKY